MNAQEIAALPTPRVDCACMYAGYSNQANVMVSAEFARRLERENAALINALKHYQANCGFPNNPFVAKQTLAAIKEYQEEK